MDLPPDLQGEIWKAYFRHHVVPGLHTSTEARALRSVSCMWMMDKKLRDHLDKLRCLDRDSATLCIDFCPEVYAYLGREDVYRALENGFTSTLIRNLKMDGVQDETICDVLADIISFYEN